MTNFADKFKHWKESFISFFVKLKENKDLFIYLIFFLVATALWFLNALRKEYVTTITYPVKYSNFPDDYILHGSTQDNLELKIRAQGYSLLPYHIGKINAPLYLSVSNFKIKKIDGTETAFVLSREYLNAVSSRLANNVELLEIFPDTLSVKLDKKQRKVVPVHYQETITYQSEYYRSGDVVLEPSIVEVSGPASIIDTIKAVNLVAMEYTDLSDSLVEYLSIEKIDNVIIKPSLVSLLVPVEAYTEKKIELSVSAINLPDTLSVRTFPVSINLTCRVPISKFAGINESLFVAVIDYNNHIGTGLPDKLKVKIVRQPEGINNLNYSPLFVECLFEKRDD